MSIETIVWTVLPTGVVGNTLSFSLYVSPRLQPAGNTTLGAANQFPWLLDWGKRAQSVSIKLEFFGGPTLPATLQGAAINPDAWNKVFPGSTPVVPFVFTDQSTRTVQSYSVRAVKQQYNALYSTVATDPTLSVVHPPLTQGSPVDAHINSLFPFERALDLAQNEQLRVKDPTGRLFDQVVNQALLDFPAAQAYWKAWRFYNRPRGTLADGEAPPPPTPPAVDFHQALAMLSDHPTLMRMLGVVLDFTCTIPTGTTMPKASRVHVGGLSFGSPAGGTAPDQKTPWTWYILTDKNFLPQPKKGSDIANGMLILSDTDKFELSEVDTEGAALKTLDYAFNMQRFRTQTVGVNKPDTASLPALRSGGFGIARVDRAAALMDQWTSQAAANMDPGNAQFYADDVTRGYRLDVLFNGNWYSLMRRTGSVNVGATAPLNVPVSDEEGYVKGASGTTPNNPGAPNDLYIHETMFKWLGWSLAAQRPGRLIPSPPATEPQRPTTTPDPNFHVQSDYHAQPKSLPRLRFGETYQFRARATDLAGNSLPRNVDLVGDYWISPKRTYVRWEPVPSPLLIPRAEFREGEAIETMVIRTQVKWMHPALPDAIFNPTNERHVLPPKTSQLMAEQHGLLDALLLTGDPTDRALAFRISCKEQGTVADTSIIDPYDTSFDPTVFPAKQVPVSGVVMPADGKYIIRNTDDVPLPYLPDPLAQGIALRFPGGGVRTHFFAGDWPDQKSFRMILSGAATLGFASIAEGISLQVPPAGIVALRYSSLVEADGLETLALAQNLPGDGAGGTPSGNALIGQHWMLTPFRELILVHAVEQPLADPQVDKVAASKGVGDTFVRLRGNLLTESHSTGDVDVRSAWTEDHDRLSDDDGPSYNEPHDGFVFTRKIGYEEPNAVFPLAPVTEIKHEFGDTRHRFVTYRGIGTTRFREYFPASVTDDPQNITRQGPASVKVNILSSARPDVPQVLYAVPTFKWQASTDGMTSKRIGRGLRIYMDRPWFSSGDGELLGVVIPPTSTLKGVPFTPEPSVALSQYVSQWGADPIWNSAPLNSALSAGRFLNRVGSTDGVLLAETGDVVSVVSFAVEYSHERKLWFCDIEMDNGGMYFPFVRLALTRFQPDSVQNGVNIDLRLSRVVKTEFAQLVADRTASVVRADNGWAVTVSGITALNEAGVEINRPVIKAASTTTTTASSSAIDQAIALPPGGVSQLPPIVIVPGLRYTASPAAGAGHLVRVQVESRSASFADDDDTLGWTPVTDEITLPSYTVKGQTDVYWRGTVPNFAVNAGLRYRLVVREYEIYDTDNDIPESLPVSNFYHPSLRSRVVYLDTIYLNT